MAIIKTMDTNSPLEGYDVHREDKVVLFKSLQGIGNLPMLCD